MSVHCDQPFPLKLHYILEQEPKVLKWNVDCTSFRIIDEDDLVGRILQQYFRTARFSSFTRNLNVYGFKKIAKGEFAGSYCHPSFRRGDVAAIASMKRSARKSTVGPDGIKSKSEGKASRATKLNRKPAITSINPTDLCEVKVKREPTNNASRMSVPQDHLFHQAYASGDIGMSTEDMSFDCSFFDGDGDGDANAGNMQQHELALPSTMEVEEDSIYSNQFQPGTPCSFMSTEEHFQNPFTEDDDLVEWKKVLSHTSHNLKDECMQSHFHHGSDEEGPNAYCVNVPAGPLGVMIEKRGDKVCLSKFTNPHSPLAHVPIGSQLVNLDGRDTTKMVVCQITKLDKSIRHRSRMIIFMRCPGVGELHQEQEIMSNDIIMSEENKHHVETKGFSEPMCFEDDDDSSPVQNCMPVSTWLSVSGMQPFYETM